MFLSLIAPEILMLWALKQLHGAFVVMRTINKTVGRVVSTYSIHFVN